MILVTVGSTHFDDLIQEVDRLVAAGDIREEVFAQIGTGTYCPRNMQWARYLSNIEEYFEKADLIISHGGSTVFEVLTLGKPVIAVANRSLQDDHQFHLLRVVAAHTWCSCCFDLKELRGLLAVPRDGPARRPRPQLPGVIWSFVTNDPNREEDAPTGSQSPHRGGPEAPPPPAGHAGGGAGTDPREQ